jgi:hypothetical protein
MLNPGELAFARPRIAFVHKLINQVVWQTIDFDQHDALDLSQAEYLTQKQ